MTPKQIADHKLAMGARFPFDAPDIWWANGGSPAPAKDWAHAAARGVLADLTDRGGIKHTLDSIDEEIRVEIVDSLADIIRAASKEQP